MNRLVVCLALATSGLLARAAAADCCCDCGCQCSCSKVCRCVPDKKKVPKITYECECEDFCVPGPSKICGYRCECPDDCCHGHAHKVPIWQPTCAKVHTRHKLVRKEEIKEVCSWKWVVEDLCPKCAAGAKKQTAENVQAMTKENLGLEKPLEPIAAQPETERPTARLASSRGLFSVKKKASATSND